MGGSGYIVGASEPEELINVGNAPASPGQVVNVIANTSYEITAANLVPDVEYKLTVVPWDLTGSGGTAPGAPTDFVRGVYKCAAAGGSIANLDDGERIFSNSPVLIKIPVGSTKVRVYFMRDSATPFDCKVTLSRADE